MAGENAFSMKLSFIPICLSFLMVTLLFYSCDHPGVVTVEKVYSPGKELKLDVFLNSEGIGYLLYHQGAVIIDSSYLGMEFVDQAYLGKELEVIEADLIEINDPWETVWGEQKAIENHYNELKLALREVGPQPREFILFFRVYDDGIGFRYQFPEQENMVEFAIAAEHSQFQLTGDHKAWWIPADYDSYEYLYTESAVSEIDAGNYDVQLAANTIMENNATATPLTLRVGDSLYLSIHEAELVDYAGMTLRVEDDKRTLTSSLVPAADGVKVRGRTPFTTPWRTIQVAESAGKLVESSLIQNLNEPNKIEETSWITPGKYVGIWWSHHLGTTTWGGKGEQQGATTENARELIDFAREHGFPYVLVEGWNTGWEHWFAEPRVPDAFDFVTPVEGFDFKEVMDYAAENGVEFIAHHETESSVLNYEQHLEAALDFCVDNNIHMIKTGYVRPIIPEGEYHHGQWMVNHYRRVIEEAAKRKIMVVSHESIKPTGERRTYPNMLARECLRGSEFNSPYGGGNPPSHLTIIPFTRMLGGPIDYTPGLVQLDLDAYREGAFVPTTVAHQLAEFVVIYGPAQMASDLPENYVGHPAFPFIKDVPTDWETSRVLNGEIGQYVTIARKERGGEDWFLGSLTNEEARELELSLDFLEPGAIYQAQIYRDGPGADFERNNMSLEVIAREVTAGDVLNLSLARGGGQAIRFRKM
jgi:hypothetical protein